MEHPNVEAARSAFEAFMKGDVETLSAGIADEAVWHIPGSHRWAGTFTGKQAVMQRFADMGAAGYATTIDEVHDVVGNDDHVIAMMRLTVTSPTGSTSGRSVWVQHVRDGRVTEFWAYNEDQAAIDAVVG